MNDICGTKERQARALAHADDPQTSKDAAEKIVKSGALDKQHQWVYDEIVRYNRMLGEDFTTKDIAKQLKGSPFLYYKNYEICKRRFSGLANKGKIGLVVREGIKRWPSGEPIYKRREGCRVWKLL